MSRSGYSESYGIGGELAAGRWSAQIASATRGKRGQAHETSGVQGLARVSHA